MFASITAFDLLSLKVASESRVTSATPVPICLPRPLCSRLMPDVRDRHTDRRQTSDAHQRLTPYPRIWHKFAEQAVQAIDTVSRY